MRTVRVLDPGELEETDDFEAEGGQYPPTNVELTPVPSAGFVYATYTRRVLEAIAAREPIGTTAGSAEVIKRLVESFRHSPSSGGAFATDVEELLFLRPAPSGRQSRRLRPSGSSLRPLKEGQVVQPVETAHEIARRTALRAPAVRVEPFTPVASANAARDLRDWTQLTVQELAAMCHVTARRFQHWLQGAPMSSRSENRLLRLRYFAAIMAAAFGPPGARRWLRAPHPELGTTPIEAMVRGRDDAVQRLVERYIESPAT